MRILAVDYGERRIGLAVGEETGRLVRAVKTLPAQGVKRDAHRLIEWADKLGADEIVIGHPALPSGRTGTMSRKVEKLLGQLRKLTDLPVRLWNEHLTSQAADEWMRARGIKPSRRAAMRDQIAACLILEDYLTHRREDERGTAQ